MIKIDKQKLIKVLPFPILGYFFNKAAQAFTSASGATVGEKIIEGMNNFSKVFSNPLPSFRPVDLLIGATGTVLVKIIIWVKGKNAKKYRKGIEYGSACWGKPEDIKPYMAEKFEDNIILTETERLTMDNRPKAGPKFARNKNVLVIGGSGSGKTRFFVKPNLLQMHSSYVVTDPKGTVLNEVGNALMKGGYKIKVLNTINFAKSMHYNPLAYTEKNIMFIDEQIEKTKKKIKNLLDLLAEGGISKEDYAEMRRTYDEELKDMDEQKLSFEDQYEKHSHTMEDLAGVSKALAGLIDLSDDDLRAQLLEKFLVSVVADNGKYYWHYRLNTNNEMYGSFSVSGRKNKPSVSLEIMKEKEEASDEDASDIHNNVSLEGSETNVNTSSKLHPPIPLLHRLQLLTRSN